MGRILHGITYRGRDCYAHIREFPNSVHREAKRRGIARRLLAHSTTLLKWLAARSTLEHPFRVEGRPARNFRNRTLVQIAAYNAGEPTQCLRCAEGRILLNNSKIWKPSIFANRAKY